MPETGAHSALAPGDPPALRAAPRAARHFDSWWWLVAAVAALIALLVVGKPDPYRRILVFVSDGLAVTLGVTLSSFVLVLGLGLAGGLCRIAPFGPLRAAATLYVEVIRGIPLLVQLYFWYFAFHSSYGMPYTISRACGSLSATPRSSAAARYHFDKQLRQNPARFIRSMFCTSVRSRRCATSLRNAAASSSVRVASSRSMPAL